MHAVVIQFRVCASTAEVYFQLSLDELHTHTVYPALQNVQYTVENLRCQCRSIIFSQEL